MHQQKIAILHPQLGFGGSEHVCLSIVEALQDDYRVSLLTTRKHKEIPELAVLNEFCQTAVSEGKVAVVDIPIPGLVRKRFAALRGAFFSRACSRLAPQFDMVFNSYGAIGLRSPAIQFIHDPAFTPELFRELTPPPRNARRLFYKDSPIRRAYLSISRMVAGSPAGIFRHNVTLVNSEWTRSRVRAALGTEARVLYPPVRCEFPEVPWTERENAFVCIGRWTREKRMERAIAILKGVREKGFDTRLHLAGNGGDPTYPGDLRRACSENAGWVTMHDSLSSRDKEVLIAGCRFGISARPNEPFGIVVAEFVKAGCIAFVANGGGQTEIVNHQALTFNDEDDAVSKICAVLSSTALQGDLRRHLAEQAQRFSVENFKAGIRQIVSEFLNLPVPQGVNNGNS